MARRALTCHALVVSALLVMACPARAEMPGKIDLEAAEMAGELLGAPVFAADGPQVGEVADLQVDEDGQFTRLRVKMGALLGIGTRTIEIPVGSFIVLRGAVVLDLPAESVQSLPELADIVDEK
jgi:sporulation protein YlmC with PRC-barrel domain